MAGSPDLFVVCKNCGSEVSPYITECPYCGQRLRKRAPKIERDAEGGSRPKVPRRLPKPTLGPLRHGEIPGIRIDETRRPYATILLVGLSVAGLILLAFVHKADVAVAGPIDGEWWRVATSPFVYSNPWYEFAAVLTIGIFGWLLERRHGPLLVLIVFFACGSGGIAAAAAVQVDPVALGGNGAALGLLLAWAVPVLLARRARADSDDDADLLGVLVLGLLVAAMPLATPDANAIAEGVGAVGGLVAGLGLSQVGPRR
jgi:membrane associated rhomboid family serine protease